MFRTNDEVYAFFGKSHPFSNHYKVDFVVTFNPNILIPYHSAAPLTYCVSCAEQAIMIFKALLFGDMDALALLVDPTLEPLQYRNIGRKVKGFNDRAWALNAPDALWCILQCKFDQNRYCADTLLDTLDKVLVEASPYDKFWGAGVNCEQALVQQWSGKNQVGRILERVRSTLNSPEQKSICLGPTTVVLPVLMVKPRDLLMVESFIDYVMENFSNEVCEIEQFYEAAKTVGDSEYIELLYGVFRLLTNFIYNSYWLNPHKPMPYRFAKWFSAKLDIDDPNRRACYIVLKHKDVDVDVGTF